MPIGMTYILSEFRLDEQLAAVDVVDPGSGLIPKPKKSAHELMQQGTPLIAFALRPVCANIPGAIE